MHGFAADAALCSKPVYCASNRSLLSQWWGGEKPHHYSNSILSSDNGVIEKKGLNLGHMQGVEAAMQ